MIADIPDRTFDRRDIVVLSLGIALTAILAVYLQINGFYPLNPSYQKESLLAYFAAWVFIISGQFLFDLFKTRPESPLQHATAYFSAAPTKKLFLRAFAYSLVLSAFGTFFSLSKRMIPIVGQYEWDEIFIAWDIAIHGRDAWVLLQPILGFPYVTWALSGLYHAWVLLIYFGNFYFVFIEKSTSLRCQYIASYFVCWFLLGIVMATTLASVGPCYTAPLLGLDHFEGQMAYLASVNSEIAGIELPTLRVQERLLQMYYDNTAILGAGISAMPSMHVSQAFLVFLVSLQKRAWIATFFGLFSFSILIGSIHLGYHYAVDGYIAIALTAFIWILTGKFIRWLDNLPLMRSRAVSAINNTGPQRQANDVCCS